MFQKPLAHKLFRKLVVSMHEVKQTLPAQEVLTPTCLDKKSPGHRDPMPPKEEEEGGKMGTCVFLASPNFGGLEVLSAPGSHPSPKAWPGLVGERWGGVPPCLPCQLLAGMRGGMLGLRPPGCSLIFQMGP